MKSSKADISLVGIGIDKVGTPKGDNSPGSALYMVPIRLSEVPDPIWSDMLVRNWDNPPRFSTMHRFGIARVIGRNIELVGTTIEEVEQYHRQTLELVVSITNQQFNERIERVAREKAEKESRKQAHEQNVRDVAERMNWRAD